MVIEGILLFRIFTADIVIAINL